MNVETEQIENTKPVLLLEPGKKFSVRKIIIGLIGLVALFAVLAALSFSSLNAAPSSFVTPTAFTIAPGTDVKTITSQLKEEGLVTSDSLLYFVIVLFFEPTDIKASTYVFDEPLTTYELAKRLTEGDFDSDLIRFIHFEGERVESIADNAEQQLVSFDKQKFLSLAVPLEGKLFPDTYFIPSTFTAEELVFLMEETFAAAIAPYEAEIASSTLTLDQILVLASIIEREANTPESMKLVSSVLQNRMAIGMPLQADASIEYILDKPLKELVPEDLKVDSAYNTYTNPGLPPTPIGNPGLDAITAVLSPTSSDYIYYITDADGNFHFSVTYDQHLDNIEKYLR